MWLAAFLLTCISRCTAAIMPGERTKIQNPRLAIFDEQLHEYEVIESPSLSIADDAVDRTFVNYTFAALGREFHIQVGR